MNNNSYRITPIKRIEEIKKIIEEFDVLFEPTIMSNIHDMNKYYEKLYVNGVTIIIHNSSDVIGFCSFYCNDYENKVAYISLIAVKPHYEGSGYSTRLLKYVENYCIENNMEKIKLEVYNKNKKGINFYIKNGFNFCEENATDNTRYMQKKI